jgi:hypothetical protein
MEHEIERSRSNRDTKRELIIRKRLLFVIILKLCHACVVRSTIRIISPIMCYAGYEGTIRVCTKVTRAQLLHQVLVLVLHTEHVSCLMLPMLAIRATFCALGTHAARPAPSTQARLPRFAACILQCCAFVSLCLPQVMYAHARQGSLPCSESCTSRRL